MKKLLISLSSSFAVLALVFQIMTPVSAQAQTSFCYTFNSNLGEGRYLSSADAQALTTALSNAGFWNSATPITTYSDSVASAVSGFQEKYAEAVLTPNGLSYGTGFVGASTRAELNHIYGCQSTSPVTTTTQCPAGYTCAPISQNPAPFVCPTGYTCSPTGSAPTTPTQPTTPVITTCPSGYTCTSTPGTPQNGNCPAGFVCTPTSPVSTSQPSISYISPNSGSSGTTVTIYGSGFQQGDSVLVSGAGIASPQTISPTSLLTSQMTFTMPTINQVQGFTQSIQNIQVSNGNMITPSVSFNSTVSTSPVCPSGYTCSTPTTGVPTPPSVTSISPTSGSLGSWISVSGSGFSSPSTDIVFQGNGTTEKVSPNTLSSNTIGLYVPSDLSLGTYTISAENLGSGWTSSNGSSVSFTITPAQQIMCPAGYMCGQPGTTPTLPTTISCPTGYICTPPGSNVSCPSGYECTNVTANCPAGYTCDTTSPVVINPVTPTCSAGFTCISSPGTPQNGNCPAGFVCSVPPVATSTCPAGFTCTTASTTNP